jgi:anti-sigma factor RsiW
MNVDSTLLLAYVDGHLSPSECAQVESQMALSPEVAASVADLRASQLPYQQAFASQKLPPVPDSLKQKIAAMARAHEKMASETLAANDRVLPAQPAADSAAESAAESTTAAVPMRSPLRSSPVRLGLAFAAGVACCAIGLALTQDPIVTGAKLAASSAAPALNAAAWVSAAAGYQQLYSRVTVEQVVVDADTAARTAAAIRREDGLAVRIPDLSAQGLVFKRVQRLRFHDQPLVQIVYLPAHGEPVALCVMREAKADHGIATERVGGMDVATWRRGELGYALIGKPEGVDLDALAKRISGGGIAHLFDDA